MQAKIYFFMLIRKKLLYICGLFILIVVFLVIPAISDYLKYKNVVQAAGGGCPMTDGAHILKTTPCVLDTPIIAPISCATSCPILDSVLTAACSQPIADALACISAAPTPPGPAAACATKIKDAIECQACENYYEVVPATSQRGIPVFGVPKTFVNYRGGGNTVMNQNGSGMIWCGDSNVSPIIVGVPSLAVKTIDKMGNWFNTYIATYFK
jgi:hypothetical protein